MFETLKRLYNGGKGKLTVAMLSNAVSKEWINEDQKQEIIETADGQ